MSTEGEPIIEIEFSDGPVYAHRWNSSVFTFLGELAAYDHIFIATDEEDNGTSLGHYVFKSNQHFKGMAEFMIKEKFPLHLNLTEVAECDSREFDRQHYNDVRNESFPEEWN